MSNDHSFLSVDKLVEFGVSMSIASKIVDSMKSSLETSELKLRQDEESLYYVAIDNKSAGPYKYEELSSLLDTQVIRKETLVWKTGTDNWKTADNFPEILKLILMSHN